MRMALNIDPNHLIDHLHSLANSTAKVSADSRQLESGDIFFAYPVGHGNALRDGRQFINAALEKGVAAVVFDPAGAGAHNVLLWKILQIRLVSYLHNGMAIQVSN